MSLHSCLDDTFLLRQYTVAEQCPVSYLPATPEFGSVFDISTFLLFPRWVRDEKKMLAEHDTRGLHVVDV